MINFFSGAHRWLSNFWPCVITAKDGTVFPSTEHAYQAAKCLHREDWPRFTGGSAAQAKRSGRLITMRPDWDQIKVTVMQRLIAQKFATGSELADKLLATEDQELIEGNTWGDTFWGICNGQGLNTLGQLLMQQRTALLKTV